eukprot:GHVH01005925.1.p1 GENE.GHVH01005925.1~~GHVH01005925.1.p1  ORF type:complete len:1631 (-),score=239.77 GHVH01005925.1:86-4978(-)
MNCFKKKKNGIDDLGGTIVLRSTATVRIISGDNTKHHKHVQWPKSPTSNFYVPWKWTNKVKTHKYEWVVFPFASFLKQCLIVTNAYFILMGFLQLIPTVSDSGGTPTFWVPVFFVIGVTMIKEFFEELARHRFDSRQNGRKTIRLNPTNGKWEDTKWGQVRPGDILKVECDEEFPCDLIILTSSDPNGIASVATVQLDGETNLKMKQAHSKIQDRYFNKEDDLIHSKLSVAMGAPSDKIYQFSGVIFIHNDSTTKLSETCSDNMEDLIHSAEAAGDLVISVGKDHFLWRGATLRATKSVTGIALYPGHQSRLFMNSRKRPTKRTALTRKAYHHIFIAGGIQVLLCCIMSGLTVSAVDEMTKHWYLRTESDEGIMGFVASNSTSAVSSFFVSFGRLSLLLSQLVPITLLVQIELSHWVHAFLMSKDDRMSVEATSVEKDGSTKTESINCTVNAVDVLDDLGCITHVFSDKTGTLTQNLMQFRCVSFNEKIYGMESDRQKWNEVDPGWIAPNEFVDFNRITAQKKLMRSLKNSIPGGDGDPSVAKKEVDGFKDMLRCLAVCHSVVVKQREEEVETSSKFKSVAAFREDVSSPDGLNHDRKSFVELIGDSSETSDTDSVLDASERAKSTSSLFRLGSDEVLVKKDEYTKLTKAQAWLWDDLNSAVSITERESATRDFECFNAFGSLVCTQRTARAEKFRKSVSVQSEEEPPNLLEEVEECEANTLKFADDQLHRATPPTFSSERVPEDRNLAYYTTVEYPTSRVGAACFDASSPDELALVCGAKQFGVEFVGRSPNDVCVALTDVVALEAFGSNKFKEKYRKFSESPDNCDCLGDAFDDVNDSTSKGMCQLPAIVFPLIDILEFDNDRKKMSVVIRDEEGNIRLLTKGADSSMLESAVPKNRARMIKNLRSMSQEGLRTLVYGQRIMTNAEWTDYERKLLMARNCSPDQQEARWQEVVAQIESEIEIIGCTGINDRLQDNCPETIADIKAAGINLWVLTGDKIETAISIGNSCNLLTQDTYNCIVLGETIQEVTIELNNAITYILAGKMASGEVDEVSRFISKKKGKGKRSQPVTLEDFINFVNFTELKGGVTHGGANFRVEDMEAVNVDQVVNFAEQYIDAFDTDKTKSKETKSKDATKFNLFGGLTRRKNDADATEISSTSSSDSDETNVSQGSLIHSPDEYYEYQQMQSIKGKAQKEAKQGLVKYSSIALTVSGSSLDLVFHNEKVTNLFFALANLCSVVIACRVTPAQKAQVVTLTKQYFSNIDGNSFRSLAIGDGANDVNMILTADVGIGIRGLEGLQASQNADISIAKFMFLKNLLFVHGHEAVRKNSLMIYHTLWKNIVFGSVCFWYAFSSLYSAVDVFNAWLKQLFNLFFTAGPIMFYVWFDTYLPYHIMMSNPRMYPIYSRPDGKMYFGSKWFLWWLILGMTASAVTVFLGMRMVASGEGHRGLISISFDDIGMLFFSTCVFIGCCTVVPFVSSWTCTMVLIYVVSIALWYLMWTLCTLAVSQDVYGSLWTLNTSITYHSAALAICSLSFLLVAIWWLYKVLFRPTLQVIITERIAMGVDDHMMLGQAPNQKTAPSNPIVIPYGGRETSFEKGSDSKSRLRQMSSGYAFAEDGEKPFGRRKRQM